MSDGQDDAPNEIVQAARDAKARERGANRRVWPIAVGVGSAALAAALLYANRNRKD